MSSSENYLNPEDLYLVKSCLVSPQVIDLKFENPPCKERLFAAVSIHNLFFVLIQNTENSQTAHSSLATTEFNDLLFKQSVVTLQFVRALSSIQQLFLEGYIPFIAFKGPILSQLLYGDPARRSFGDLDILITKQFAFHAMNILAVAGYTPEVSLTIDDFKKYSLQEDNISLFNATLNVTVELHWDLTGHYLLQEIVYEDLADRFEIVKIGSTNYASLGREDLLVYLCVHGTKHLWSRLEWLVSVAKLITINKHLDWSWIVVRIDALRCRRMFLLAMFLVDQLWCNVVPDEILKLVEKDRRIPCLGEKIFKRLFPLHDRKGIETQEDRFSFFHIKVRDSWCDGVKYALLLLTRPTINEWKEAPVWMRGVLLPLFRLFRLPSAWLRINQK